jgi:prepilin-type N-terminal cleavage/methylation domain-containing protein
MNIYWIPGGIHSAIGFQAKEHPSKSILWVLMILKVAKAKMQMLASLKHRKLGFTLLELLVVISLLSILAVVGARVYRDKNSNIYLNAVINALEDARFTAINQGRQIALACNEIASGGKSSITDRFDISCTSTLPSSTEKNTITFFPDSSSSGGIITVRHNGQDSTIKIDWLTGKFDQN